MSEFVRGMEAGLIRKGRVRKLHWLLSVLLFTMSACLSLALAGEAVRIATIPPSPEAGPHDYLCLGMSGLVRWGERAVWPAGPELWIADPERGVVEVLRDVRAGGTTGGVGNIVGIDDRLFFLAHDGQLGWELWASDGTATGTGPILDLQPGPYHSGIENMTAFQGSLAFTAPRTQDGSTVLWISDGTAAGTRVVSGVERPGPLLAVGTSLVGAAQPSGAAAPTLWRLDGVSSKPAVLTNLTSGSRPLALAGFTSGAIAMVQRGTALELWRSNMTGSGTKKFTELMGAGEPLVGGPAWAVEAAGRLFFILVDAQQDYSLWRSDGSSSGTYRLAAAGLNYYGIRRPPHLAALAGVAFFTAADDEHGMELWRSTGTLAGTEIFVDIDPGPRSSNPEWLTAAGGKLFFIANDGLSGRELWVTDGTADGTTAVADVCPGPFGAFVDTDLVSWEPAGRPIVSVGDKVAFLASAGMEGCRLWVSDGTEGGTAPVAGREIVRSAWNEQIPPSPIRYLAVNGSVFIPGGRDYTGRIGVLRTDGTDGSIEPIDDPLFHGLFPDWRSEWPRVHGQMFAPGNGSVVRTDGTVEGSAVAFPGAMGRASEAEDGRWYFWRDGRELWRSDGTPAGTSKVFTLGRWQGEGPVIVSAAGLAFFAADDGVHGAELWRSDGSSAGTGMVADLCEGPCSSDPTGLVASGNRVYFTVWPGTALCVSDGTPEGTRRVAGAGGSVMGMAPLAGGLLFATYDTFGEALQFAPPGSGDAATLGHFTSTNLGDARAPFSQEEPPLLFAADDGAHGQELWRSDGTAAGTSMVRDISPGVASSAPMFFTRLLGRTFFTASDPEHGAEPWSSDGTEAGTKLEVDVEPGAGSAIPLGFRSAGNRVVFEVQRYGGRRELWSARVSPLPRVDVMNALTSEGSPGDGFARVTVTLTEVSANEASVAFRTEDGTAKAGDDYLPTAGRLTFAPGSVGPLQILVPIVDDSMPEQTEEFFVVLTDPDGCVLGRESATVTVEEGGVGRTWPRRRIQRGLL